MEISIDRRIGYLPMFEYSIERFDGDIADRFLLRFSIVLLLLFLLLLLFSFSFSFSFLFLLLLLDSLSFPLPRSEYFNWGTVGITTATISRVVVTTSTTSITAIAILETKGKGPVAAYCSTRSIRGSGKSTVAGGPIQWGGLIFPPLIVVFDNIMIA